MKISVIILAAASLLPLVAITPPASAQELITNASLDQSVGLANVSVDPNGNVSGVILNRTDLTVRQVKLMINYAWVWRNDFKPGEDSPGRTVYVTAPADIPAHGQGSFSYQPSPPLSSRGDGRFAPSVHIVGYTRMVPPGA